MDHEEDFIQLKSCTFTQRLVGPVIHTALQLVVETAEEERKAKES